MKKYLIVAILTLLAPLTTSGAEKERVNRFDRVDREINKNVFAYKGEWITGLTASYTTLSTQNAEFLLFVDNLDASFGMTSIKPYVGYNYKNNQAAGLRLGYNYVNGELNSARIDLGESTGIETIDIPYIHVDGEYYSAAAFHRSYVALDKNGRFGLFAEVELAATVGEEIFEYGEGSGYVYTRSDKTSVALNFNPGASVFVMPNVSASVSFGFGGIDYTKIRQYDENGVESGGREQSGMSFKFNFLAVNFGVTVHIWKKQ